MIQDRRRLSLTLALAALSAMAFGQSPPPPTPAPVASVPRPPTPTPLPPSADLRPQLEAWKFRPRSQGTRGTCSVFVVTGALEFALARRTGQPVPLSVEFLNWAANDASGKADDGDFFHNCLQGFQRHGICCAAAMPYQKAFDPEARPSEPALAAARDVLATHGPALTVHWINPWTPKAGLTAEHLDGIRRALAAGWPVAGGSGHSVLFVGYRDAATPDADGVLIARDSAAVRDVEIPYAKARERFGDVFWIEAAPAADPEKR